MSTSSVVPDGEGVSRTNMTVAAGRISTDPGAGGGAGEGGGGGEGGADGGTPPTVPAARGGAPETGHPLG